MRLRIWKILIFTKFMYLSARKLAEVSFNETENLNDVNIFIKQLSSYRRAYEPKCHLMRLII